MQGADLSRDIQVLENTVEKINVEEIQNEWMLKTDWINLEQLQEYIKFVLDEGYKNLVETHIYNIKH